LCLLLAAVAEAVPPRKSAAVQVFPGGEQDVEVANQVRKIALDTLENYRNFITKRYLADKDLNAHEEIAELVGGGNKKVSAGMRSSVFDEGVEQLNSAYLKAKAFMGELDPKQIADLFLGLSMAKAVMEDRSLAVEYMMVYRNLSPGSKRNSVGYSKLFLDVFDSTEKQLGSARKFKVTIEVDPPGALVGIDGREWGRAPFTAEVTAGGHLVQIESEGYYRGGWIKDPSLHGNTWKVSLLPIESRRRYLETTEKLLDHFAPEARQPKEPKSKRKKRRKKKKAAPPPPPPDPVKLLESLVSTLKVDYLLFLAVTADGNRIRLRGAFVSQFGVYAISEQIPRNMKIIESVRRILLAASDLDSQKDQLVKLRAAEQQQRLDSWARGMVEQMASGEQTLLERARLWNLVDQPKKAELFAKTSAEVLVMLKRARGAMEKTASNPEEARKELDLCEEEWKQLGSKVRSLLAWDVHAAMRARKTRKLKKLADSAREKLEGLLKLREKKNETLDKKEARALDKELKQMGRTLDKLEVGMRKDALSIDVRTTLYGVLIREAELKRRLSLK